jgi:glyoxylase-like metal-dependent hydrolase (beta-lactamase superfamily II)
VNEPNLTWRVGEVTVTRVAESVIPLRPELLLPEVTDDLIDGERPWIDPFFDDRGRIRLSVHTFVVESDGATIVVDTCVGGEPGRPLPSDPGFLDRLDATIVGGTDAVDVVLCTHLHFDHVGWNTVVRDGTRVPTFANARYLFGAAEWAGFAKRDHDGIADTSIRPVIDAGLADLVETDHRITDEVRLIPTTGHTPGHVSVLVESGTHSALITGDVVHSPIQFAHPAIAASADHDADAARSTRRSLIARFAGTDTLILGTHFAPPTGGYLHRDGAGGVRFV